MARTADLDRGSAAAPRQAKKAATLASSVKDERDDERAGLRELDDMLEQTPGLTRAARDRDRAMPRDATAEQVRARNFPADGEQRRLTVYRQRELNKQKTALDREKLPRTAKQAFADTFSSNQALSAVNDQLSDAVGDAQALSESTRRHVQRTDRVLQAAERINTNEHLVYCNLETPAGVNRSNVQAWLRNNFDTDTEVNFDRYTVGSHDTGQIANERRGWAPMLEIKTRRGMYVGKAPKGNNTNTNAAHLLPRGMQLRCVGIKTVSYQAADGTSRQRLMLQMEDHR